MGNSSSYSKPVEKTPVCGDIHIWWASLDEYEPHYKELLSADERTRAERFRFDKDRDHFIVCRAILRDILGSYLNREPHTLEFSYGKNGKPSLNGVNESENIDFNLSQSGGQAVYAVTRGRDIGVDIEYIRYIPDMQDIIERYFSAGEKGVFKSLPEAVRYMTFYKFWTRKEAFIKATGDGLSFPLDKFDVSKLSGGSAGQLIVNGDTGVSSHWYIQDLNPVSGFAAAVVVKGPAGRIRCRQLAGESGRESLVTVN